MKRTVHLATAVGVWLALASPVLAQQATESAAPETAATEAASPSDPAARDADKEAADRDTAIKESWTKGRPISMQYIRPQDKRGLNVFETTKEPGAEFSGFKLDFGARSEERRAGKGGGKRL